MTDPAYDGPPPRRTGRPRNPDCDRAILAATLDLLADHGIDGLSVEAVAARAGVGKTTIYRRWPGKADLVVDAIARVTDPTGGWTPTGRLRDDLVGLLTAARERARATIAGRVLPRLLAEQARHPELVARYRDQVVLPRRQALRAVLAAGQARGEIRADADLELAVDQLVGPVVYRELLRRLLPEPEPDHVERLVDAVLAGVAAR